MLNKDLLDSECVSVMSGFESVPGTYEKYSNVYVRCKIGVIDECEQIKLIRSHTTFEIRTLSFIFESECDE